MLEKQAACITANVHNRGNTATLDRVKQNLTTNKIIARLSQVQLTGTARGSMGLIEAGTQSRGGQLWHPPKPLPTMPPEKLLPTGPIPEAVLQRRLACDWRCTP